MADDVSEDDPPANHPKASSICAIDKKSVHRICSGQVVLTLATAVKELLENSIDAGATIVDIKLKDYGRDSIEVSDNGQGVEADNFQGLTLKHHTSKLQDFTDLINVETFGFRGEALSSLCALCDMCIITRHKDASVATRLEYDHNGIITKTSSLARQVGTTVLLQNLFSTLPVRHKEFQKNIKKEFVKMTQILNSYCIISSHVKITCSNQTGKGSRSVVVSTKGNQTLLENISNVFGPKQTQTLLQFKQKRPSENEKSEFGLKSLEEAEMFSIDGYVSKCDHGLGRCSTDRQFFFINGRPFDSNKLSKVVNEVYHQYNRHQYPFVVLTVNMNKDGVDVNVTPDKRQVFMDREKLMLAILKTSLLSLYEPTTSVIQMQLPVKQHNIGLNKGEHSPFGLTKHQSLEKPDGMTSLMKLKRSFSSAFDRSKGDEQGAYANSGSGSKQRRLDCFMSSSKPSPTKADSSGDKTKLPENSYDNNKSLNESENIVASICSITSYECDEDYKDKNQVKSEVSVLEHTLSRDSTVLLDEYTKNETKNNHISITSHSLSVKCDETGDHAHNSPLTVKPVIDHVRSNISNCETDDDFHATVLNVKPLVCHKSVDSAHSDQLSEQQLNPTILDCDYHMTIQQHHHSCEDSKTEGISDDVECQQEIHDHDEEIARHEKVITFSMDKLKRKYTGKGSQDSSQEDSTDRYSRAFRAKISPTDNQAAEQELQREIKKENFCQMEILGQFNLGFIIAKLASDLFIIDQHATDEKYNFETLQRDYIIQSQRLICPLSLGLTASSEMILMDSIDVFTKNGFEFHIDETAPPTERVKLTATPVSKNWNFGKEDIEEMIFMLTDSPGVTCRPSRVRAMFASRSCRKSVMIGTTLNTAEMKKLVTHMGEIEQPWNCPHGRPTLRHLINLNMLPT